MSQGDSELLRLFVLVILAAAWVAVPATGFANNGLNLIGFGSESLQMAGADVAVARNAFALNSNPAGLTQVPRQSAEVLLSTAVALDVAHADRFDNDTPVSKKLIPILSNAFAMRLTPDMVGGLGLFAQGGAGDVYKQLNTAFGTRDDLWSLFGILKLSAGAGYRVHERLSVGASLAAVYGRAKQNVFGNTSMFNAANPHASFFGYRIDGASGLNGGLRLGLLWRARDDLNVGLSVANKVNLPLDNGALEANMSSIGLGTVRYSRVRIDGLALPNEVSLGAAWHAAPDWLVAFKWTWLGWADALNSTTLVATRTGNALASGSFGGTSSLDWSNQNVFAIGVEHTLANATTLRAGINYGRNPIPARTLNPLLAAFGESHLTVGLSRRFAETWSIDAGLEYLLPKSVTYTNPQLPFGPGAQERNSYVAVLLGLSRRW